MANFSDQAAADEMAKRTVADAVTAVGAGWLLDAIAVVSSGVSTLALKLALQLHVGVAPVFAGMAAGAVGLGLVVGHFIVRPRASPPPVAKRRTRRPVPAPVPDHSAEPSFAPGPSAFAPSPQSASPVPPAPQLTIPAEEPAFAAPPPASVAGNDLGHLQQLVAELARTTPGPKASSPDPDAAHQVATAQAWAQYAVNRAADGTQQPAASPQATQSNEPVPLTGFAADLSDALAADRMTIYLEPIQQIETDRPRYYEVSVRFKDETGAELPHRELLAAARETGQIPRIDAAVLPRAARIAQHFRVRGRDTDIFSRVHGISLPDQDFRAEVTAATIAADGPALVLSFEQSDLRGFGPVHWEILSTMQDMGLRFAVEGVVDLDMDFEALHHRGFEFVKLDVDVLLRGLPAFGGMIASADVCGHLAASGLALVVGHIDDDETLARILGFGVLFGQGAIFGTRRAVRSDILASPAAAA